MLAPSALAKVHPAVCEREAWSVLVETCPVLFLGVAELVIASRALTGVDISSLRENLGNGATGESQS